jgi:hypothetical protein
MPRLGATNWVVLVMGPTHSDCAVIGPFGDAGAACLGAMLLERSGESAKVYQLWTAQQFTHWRETGQ